MVAGATRARSLLIAHLGTPLRESVVVVDREVDASSDLIEEVADRAARPRAAAVTGAELRFVPDGEQPPRSGVGALLRYPVPQA